MDRFVKVARVGGYVIVGTFVLLVVLALASPLIVRAVFKGRVEAQIAAIQARGEPISQSELKPPSVPDEENAAVFFEKIFAEMEKEEFEADNEAFSDFRSKQERDSKLKDDVRKALARNKHILPMIEEALAMPHCVFPIDWDEPLPTFPHLGKLRRLSSLLLAHAVISAEDGNTEEAVRSLELIYLLSETIKDEPAFVPPLVRTALIGTGTTTLQQLMSVCQFDEQTARGLYDFTAGIDLNKCLQVALMGERTTAIDLFETMRMDPSKVRKESDARERKKPGSLLTALMYLNQWHYLKTTERWMELFELPYRESKRLTSDYDDMENIPRYAFVSAILLPVISRSIAARDRAIAQLNGSRIFLALAAYRDRHGNYPKSLGELRERLGWEIPEDPFSGEDFIYRQEGDGFVLYSIGQNLTDNEAEPWEGEDKAPRDYGYIYTDPISSLKTADIVWRMER